MAGKVNIKLKDILPANIVEAEPSTESNEGKVYNPEQENTQPEFNGGVFQEMESQHDPYKDDSPIVYTFPVDEPGHLDLLKNALTLIIDKAEAIDIKVDKPKLLGKLKGALKILNQN